MARLPVPAMLLCSLFFFLLRPTFPPDRGLRTPTIHARVLNYDPNLYWRDTDVEFVPFFAMLSVQMTLGWVAKGAFATSNLYSFTTSDGQCTNLLGSSVSVDGGWTSHRHQDVSASREWMMSRSGPRRRNPMPKGATAMAGQVHPRGLPLSPLSL
uniref:Uncharacterized protein n=1 Tax=Oryza meridionalis TaxID=40149 RepID=A0A0E0EKS8_9ORYZ